MPLKGHQVCPMCLIFSASSNPNRWPTTPWVLLEGHGGQTEDCDLLTHPAGQYSPSYIWWFSTGQPQESVGHTFRMPPHNHSVLLSAGASRPGATLACVCCPLNFPSWRKQLFYASFKPAAQPLFSSYFFLANSLCLSPTSIK